MSSENLNNLSQEELNKILKEEYEKNKKLKQEKKERTIQMIEKLKRLKLKPKLKLKRKAKTFDEYFKECIKNKTIPKGYSSLSQKSS